MALFLDNAWRALCSTPKEPETQRQALNLRDQGSIELILEGPLTDGFFVVVIRLKFQV